MHGSRPLRSSPLAGPSIAVSQDGTLSAPPTPRGRIKHLSPLAEFSTTAGEDDDRGDNARATTTKRHRRRSFGAVLSKVSFPSSVSGPDLSAPAEPTKRRQRSNSTSARIAIPAVPPLPAWAQSNTPSRNPRDRSPQLSSPSSARPLSLNVSTKSSSSSPTGRPESTGSRKSVFQQTDPRTGAPVRLAPSTSRNPEENWLTQSAAPRFSRLGLRAEGVILPVSAHEARRRSTASTLTVRAKSLEALPPPLPTRAHSSSRNSAVLSLSGVPSRASIVSLSGVASLPQPPLVAPPSRRSRTSSFASGSSGRLSVDCDTPSLTMSPGPSASDVSLSLDSAVDELGVLSPASPAQVRVSSIPVGVIGVPEEAHHNAAGKGKEREYGHGARPPTATSIASIGSINSAVSGQESASNMPIRASWAREPVSPSGSERSSLFGFGGSAADPHSPTYVRHGRPATAPEPIGAVMGEKGMKGGEKRRLTIGRMWKQVVHSVTARR